MQDRNKLEDQAEYHHRSMMTPDERAIDARDRVAKNIHEQNQRDGKNSTFDSALIKATEIAHGVLRKGTRKKGR